MSGGRPPGSKARLRLWLQLLKLSRQVDARVREALRAEFATTLPRFDVMSALNRYRDGLKMSRLSEVLRVSGGNVTGIVDRLTEEGMAERLAVPGDRRASVVRLTARGRAEFARQAVAHEGWINALLADFDGEEAEALARRLARAGERAEQEKAET